MSAILLVFLMSVLQAQSPHAFKYQAVARNSTGQVLANTDISLKISIIQGNPLGTVQYSEIHYKTTNSFGLVNLEIGRGTVVSGDFSAIAWSDDKYFLKVEMDPSGGSSFSEMGTGEILSVPYALYAEKSGNASDNDADPTNELQSLSISKDTLWLSDDGFVKLPGGELSQMPDIDTTGIKKGDVLKWDGTGWVPLAIQTLFVYYHADRDQDGYGDPYNKVYSMDKPDGYVENEDDCNDRDSTIHKYHSELCDDRDNDCDGLVDEGCDVDNDGIEDINDNCKYTYNPGQEDLDDDGEGDACDMDDDGDDIPDDMDNCPLIPNFGQEDFDMDGIGDVCDDDHDNDGVLNEEDNCPDVSNPTQVNTDGDSMGDACDPDDDNDGVPDEVDNCPLVSNPGQENNDGDAHGDVCDTDDDNDGIPDATDNCPFVSNPGQENNDGDAQGDACDPDDDNDGILDGVDNCPYVYNPGQENFDGDAQGDACDPDDDNDGDPDATDCNDNNPNIRHGATEVCNGIDDNCNGSVDENTCPPTEHVMTTNCAGIAGCQITACESGYGDLDKNYENGCECPPDVYEDNNVCLGAYDLGLVPSGTTIFQTGKISTLSDVDFYHIQTIDQGLYDVNISFSINPGGEFVFDIYLGDCANADVINAIHFHDPDTGPSVDSKEIYIKVHRLAAATPTCNDYELMITNVP